jgi:hypothetical protein
VIEHGLGRLFDSSAFRARENERFRAQPVSAERELRGVAEPLVDQGL